MSQLLCRIAKLPSSQGLCFSELRRFSTAATPYLLLNKTNYRAASKGEIVVDINLYDPRKDERVKIQDQTLSEELVASVKMGSSRGWVGVKNVHDSTVRLTNVFNPCASVSSHKVITLPPLNDSRFRVVSNLCLSASPEQQDCVVAVWSYRSLVGLCRPGDSVWTHIEVPVLASEMVYSVKDSRFYLRRVSKEDYKGLVDLINTSSGFPQVSLYQRLPNSDIPESIQDQVTSTIKTQHMVESPSGESFVVYWCKELLNREEILSSRGKEPTSRGRRKPSGFVVFRQDLHQGIGSYTEDIGDLCIFLGKSEAFCVRISRT
ncbi:unnamed protein product [Thlaspi arvense]|uniref:KIB1-4 beta-propeller domain-containing protein n=1 Tax=Thlaspi arvense TaxID=13288 RepID=A0AAU9T281_THLAR|nr:unnamed protein product [Thlaspi arvense]